MWLVDLPEVGSQIQARSKRAVSDYGGALSFGQHRNVKILAVLDFQQQFILEGYGVIQMGYQLQFQTLLWKNFPFIAIHTPVRPVLHLSTFTYTLQHKITNFTV